MRSIKILSLLVVLSAPARGMITKQTQFINKFSKSKHIPLSFTKNKAQCQLNQDCDTLMAKPPQFINSPKFRAFHSTPIQIAIKSSDVIQKQPKIAKYLSLIKQHKAPKVYYINPKEVEIMQAGIGGAMLGFWGGQTVVYGLYSGLLYGIQIGGDCICPGAGTVTSMTVAYVTGPLVVPIANAAGIAGGIAVGTATGPA